MTTARRRRRRARALVPLVALALAAGACGGDDDPPDTPSPSTTEAPPTTAAPSPEDEVEAAYLAYWDMVVRLSAAPDPDDPELPQRAVDPALGSTIDTLSTLRAQGQEVHVGPQYRREVVGVRIEADVATVDDCTVDDSAHVDSASGETLRENVTTVQLQARMVQDGDRWAVSEVTQVETWDGIGGCAQ